MTYRSHRFILSIDGGGMRGLLFLHVLAALENALKRPLSSVFSIVAGVSTGAIIALGLTLPQRRDNTSFLVRDDTHSNSEDPQSDPEPAYTCQQLMTLYRCYAGDIFHPSFGSRKTGRFVFGAPLYHLFHPKYNPSPGEKLYKSLFYGARLSHALSTVVIPAYNIASCFKNPGLHVFSSHAQVFSSFRVDPESPEDYLMHDVVLSTCAAPTYFPPHRPSMITPQGARLSPKRFIDGSVAMNNPSILGYLAARQLYPHDALTLISLGLKNHSAKNLLRRKSGGLLGWRKYLPFLITEPHASAYCALFPYIAQHHPGPMRYRRWEIDDHQLPPFDDCSPQAIAYMDQKGSDIVQKLAREIQELVMQVLDQDLD